MSYNIPYSSDYENWYGTPQNVSRLSARLTQTRNDKDIMVGRIACSWDIPDNGGTFIVLVSTDGADFTVAKSGVTGNSAVIDVEPNTEYYVKVVTVLGANQSEGTVSERIGIVDSIPVPPAPVATMITGGLQILVGDIPPDYTVDIVIGEETIGTEQPVYVYFCEDGEYTIKTAYRDSFGNTGEYSEEVTATVSEIATKAFVDENYVRKNSHYYIKRAEVNGSALMLTTGDNQVIIFQGGGGGSVLEPIVQDDDTIILPAGYMDGTIRQQMLTILFKPSRMLILS